MTTRSEEEINNFKKEILEIYKKYDLCIAASDEMEWGIIETNDYMIFLFKNSLNETGK